MFHFRVNNIQPIVTIEEVFNTLSLSNEIKDKIQQKINLETNRYIKDFILKAATAQQFKLRNPHYIRALKDMLETIVSKNQADASLMENIFQIATGNCATPIITAVINHSFILRRKNNEEIPENEIIQAALMEYFSKNIRTDDVEKIEVINGMVNAIFSRNAGAFNKGIFKVKASDLTNMEPLGLNERFGYKQIRKDHIDCIKNIFKDKKDGDYYVLDEAKIFAIVKQFKHSLGMYDRYDSSVANIDKQLITFFLSKDVEEDFFNYHPWRGFNESQRQGEIYREFRKLTLENPRKSESELIEIYVEQKKVELLLPMVGSVDTVYSELKEIFDCLKTSDNNHSWKQIDDEQYRNLIDQALQEIQNNPINHHKDLDQIVTEYILDKKKEFFTVFKPDIKKLHEQLYKAESRFFRKDETIIDEVQSYTELKQYCDKNPNTRTAKALSLFQQGGIHNRNFAIRLMEHENQHSLFSSCSFAPPAIFASQQSSQSHTNHVYEPK